MLFLKQTLRSNYCGIYSLGMLLSLMGQRTNRHSAFRLFSLSNPRNYNGATHAEIAEAFGRATGRRAEWRLQRRWSFSRLLCELEPPTLITFRADLDDLSCTHVCVVTAVGAEEIRLLDPLGRRPAPRRPSNGVIRRNSTEGLRYAIDRSAPLRLLAFRRK